MPLLRSIAAMVVVMLLRATALADEGSPLASSGELQSPVDLTAHHHLGFYLHLDAGIGGLRASAPSGWVKSGLTAGRLGIAIGGALSEDFILAGRAWNIDRAGRGQDTTRVTLSGVGPELIAYFMPANIFVSIAPSFTTLSVNNSSYGGYGLLGGVGKEWWTSAHWGLGITGQGFVSGNSWNGTAWTFGGQVALSGTYN
jgi:hypothetical protein